MTIKLLVADDQDLVRQALCALLALQPDFEVVAQVGRGDEVVAAVLEHRPDVALLDIEMPGIDGLAAAAVLTAKAPGCKVVILTTFGRAGYLRRAMDAGAAGFVVKDAKAEALADAIRRVLTGEKVVDPALAVATLTAGESPLTARERDVLTVARNGSTVAEIAGKAVPVRGDSAELPVERDRQDGDPQPDGGRAGGRRARLAVTAQPAVPPSGSRRVTRAGVLTGSRGHLSRWASQRGRSSSERRHQAPCLR